jgi:hypothetical protein
MTAHVKAYNARPEVKDQTNARQRADRLTASGRARALLRGMRYRCKLNGLAYDLNEKDVVRMITDCVCPYTMQSFVLVSGRHPWAPSIDRIDNAKGYTQDNVQVVSLWWNIAKNEWPEAVTVRALAGLKRALQDMELVIP